MNLEYIKRHKKEIIIAVTSVAVIFGLIYVGKNYLTHKGRLKHNAKKDLKKWKDKKETDKSVSDELVSYWKLTGKNFTKDQMQQKSFHSSYPWSSAYIGHLVDKSGYKNFKPSASHSSYVVDSKENRKNELKNSYWAYKPSELQKVEVGDILVKGRSGSKPNLDTINRGVVSHGDIVVDITSIKGQKYAITQGGNVSDSVAQTKVPLTESERLLNTLHFAQLKYKG